MSEYTIKPLGPDTWDAFARLAERHNGVWGGCWCNWFHPRLPEKARSAAESRARKERRVDEGLAGVVTLAPVLTRVTVRDSLKGR